MKWDELSPFELMQNKNCAAGQETSIKGKKYSDTGLKWQRKPNSELLQ